MQRESSRTGGFSGRAKMRAKDRTQRYSVEWLHCKAGIGVTGSPLIETEIHHYKMGGRQFVEPHAVRTENDDAGIMEQQLERSQLIRVVIHEEYAGSVWHG
jgi:hypothetical protein